MMDLPPELFPKNYSPKEKDIQPRRPEDSISGSKQTTTEAAPVSKTSKVPEASVQFCPSRSPSNKPNAFRSSQRPQKPAECKVQQVPAAAKVSSGRKENQKSLSFKKAVSIAISIGIIFLFVTCGSQDRSSRNWSATTSTASASEKSAKDLVEEAQECLEKGDKNGALVAIVQCSKQYPDSAAATKCRSLYDQLYQSVKDNEPKNGETLERTFQYLGGCILRATAESGPALITISFKNDPSAYAKFYVRSGQTAEINVTGGTYLIEYQRGYLWLDDTLGFGDSYENKSFEDDFVFKTETIGGWVTHDTIEITV